MRIKCIQRTAGLKLDKVYIPVIIEFDFYKSIQDYYIVDENGVLGIYSSKYFEIVDAVIEDGSLLLRTGDFIYQIINKTISYEGFLMDFHNQEENALRLFEALYPDLFRELM